MTKQKHALYGFADMRMGAARRNEGPHVPLDESMPSDAETLPLNPAAPAPPRLPIGARVLDRYVLIEPLASPSGNTRYLAQDEVGHLQVVLTLVRVGPQDADDGSYPSWRIAKQLRCLTEDSHLLRIVEIHRGRFDGITLLGIVQPYAEGGSLRGRFTRDNPSILGHEMELKALIRQMALGVATLHRAGIAGLRLDAEHFVFSDGVLKLDGLACLSERAHLAGAREKAADVRLLGHVLVSLLSAYAGLVAAGKAPESGPNTTEGWTSMPLTRHLRRVIECCLSPNPACQFCDALELVRALEDESMAWDAEDRAARDEAWRDIESTMALGDLVTAASACDTFLRTWPNDQNARTLAAKLQAQHADAQRVYDQIADAMGAGTLGRLVDLLQQAVELYPDHPAGVGVQLQIASFAREFQNCMKSGSELLQQGAWEAALQCFQRAHALDQGSPAVLQALDFVTSVVRRVRSMHAEIDDAIRHRDKAMALAQARALDAYVDMVRTSLPKLDG